MNLLPQNENQFLQITAEVALRFLDLDLAGQDRLPIDLNPQSTPASLLPALAFELGMEMQGLSEAERRTLLGSALEIRYMEGSLHATTLALQAVFGNKARVRRWFEEGAYTPEPHHFDIVIDFDEAFPAESFLAQVKTIQYLLRYAKKVSAHFHFFAKTPLPEARITVSSAMSFQSTLTQKASLFQPGLEQPLVAQGAIIWDF